MLVTVKNKDGDLAIDPERVLAIVDAKTYADNAELQLNQPTASASIIHYGLNGEAITTYHSTQTAKEVASVVNTALKQCGYGVTEPAE